MNKIGAIYAYILLIVATGLIFAMALQTSHMKHSIVKYDDLVRWEKMDSTFLYRAGHSGRFGYYTLQSFNGGKDWYEMDGDSIVGLADPKLIKYLNAWKTIKSHVKKYGSIHTKEDVYLLEEELNAIGMTIDTINVQ